MPKLRLRYIYTAENVLIVMEWNDGLQAYEFHVDLDCYHLKLTPNNFLGGFTAWIEMKPIPGHLWKVEELKKRLEILEVIIREFNNGIDNSSIIERH